MFCWKSVWGHIMNRLLIAHTPIGDNWWATSLKGAEALSELYAFTLMLESEQSGIDGQKLIGEVCAVELEAQRGLRRYFSGQIVKVTACGREDRHWTYKVLIAPKLWHASRRADFKTRTSKSNWTRRTERAAGTLRIRRFGRFGIGRRGYLAVE